MKHKHAKETYERAKTILTPAREAYTKTLQEAFARNAKSEEIEAIDDDWREECDQVLSFRIFVRGMVEDLTEQEKYAISNGIVYWDDKIFATTLKDGA